ncbi:DeoR faimly transcriptional regulator [Micromonospora sp. NRRL B-16802]|uniref:phosphonoacetaldehyde dehydrogenase n=1 Tax=Micromonospora sp. NRRL B-16802 TaxID=1415541 RepID=UPI0003C92C60|nr:phosphonoacetaldehyde dehydrogenase [Micromonospora sp. NRRL B-16802]AGZ94285.1 NAD-dependent aldehyde dehydrogenase [Micromonospora sp. NRRL B-16802]KOX14625.1 DeoR faimly transcriptional regulator [Micromonospora sp. NRRL B-16802]
MSAAPESASWRYRHEGLRIGGETLNRDRTFAVHHPHTGDRVATVAMATADDVRHAVLVAERFRSRLSRHDRYTILMRARELIDSRREEWARLITMESGLCLKDTDYEVGRACDVLMFAANQALVDDGEIYSCDLTPHGRARKVFTTREPLLGVIGAITPFNHPLNQVVHKVAPAVATNNRLVLKPSEKTPLAALAFADTLYEAGLPPPMFQVVTGDPAEIGPVLIGDPHVELVTFTGGTEVGKRVAASAGYRRTVVELGGTDPAIVLDDADLAETARLILLGACKNSGQRCTAVKRVLVQAGVADEFVALLTEQARQLRTGDPFDSQTDIGTVIDEQAARRIGAAVDDAVRAGAVLRHGGVRSGAHYAPTVLDHVVPTMAVVTEEVFGPVAPVVRFTTDEEAVQIANSSRYALSAGVFTKGLDRALRFVNELHAGTVNIGEVPGYRIESTPFGGIKDSGLGYKEGVVETMKAYTNVKTFSLPWQP